MVLMNVKNFMQPNLTKIRQIETIFDPLNALKWLFLVMFQKICTFMRKINQTLPYFVKQGASVCTEEIPHNPTTKFRAIGFFWSFFLPSHSVSFYGILNLSGVMNHMFYEMPVFEQSSLAQNYHKWIFSCQKIALKQVVNVAYTIKNWCLIIQWFHLFPPLPV